jgi:hypothetical protein
MPTACTAAMLRQMGLKGHKQVLKSAGQVELKFEQAERTHALVSI